MTMPTDWTEDYTDPLEELRRAQETDKAATDRAAALARMQEGVDMFVQRRTSVPHRPVPPVDDAMKAFLLSRKFEDEGQQRDLMRSKIEASLRPKLGEQQAPMSWGSPEGMTRDEALRAGYGRAPKPPKPAGEMAPEEWYDRLRAVGISKPENMYRDEAMKLLQADIGRQGQVAAAVGAEDRRTEREKPEKVRQSAAELRKEFQNQQTYKDTQALATAYEKIMAAQPTAAGDISLVYGYMRLMDPGSTVREGEFATAQNAGGIPDRIRAAYNKAVSGERLAPDVRTEFKSQASQVLTAQRKQYDQLATQYQELAKKNGIDPGEVILDIGLPSADANVPPVPGAVKSKSGRWMIKNAAGKWEYL